MKKVLLAVLMVSFMVCGRGNLSAQSYSDYLIPEEKNPGTAFLYSLVIPGAGQMHNDQVGKGFLIFTTSILSGCAAIILNEESKGIDNEKQTGSILLGVLSAGIWLYSIIDAPVTASKMNDEIQRKKAKLYQRGLLGNLLDEDINLNIEPYYKNAGFGISLTYNF